MCKIFGHKYNKYSKKDYCVRCNHFKFSRGLGNISNSMRVISSMMNLEKTRQREQQGLCRYCGGKLKLLGKICKQCNMAN